jgi:YidC/Oxa1 family membrane protein insertase
MSVLAVFDPAVDLAYAGLTALANGIQPVFGGSAVAAALVIVTVVARACLLPFAISVLRAQRAKQALAPTLDRLRRRHRSDPARLLRELQAAHREAGISPLAGLLPALAQAPAMIVIYRLCKLPVIAGAQNAVLVANLFTAPLAAHAPAVIATAGIFSSAALVVAALAVILLALAYLSSRQQVSRVRAASAGEVPALQILIARVMPYGTAIAVAVVPLAVSLYLITSTAWLVTERALLPRFF